ncbi:DUF551 domain-containing protein [Hymenobacter swuensis]|uniref:DUF551 domain-containing protein n=1 Tax=Hymenobacter swuensis TaxID=1446467 RepID=UPI0009005291
METSLFWTPCSVQEPPFGQEVLLCVEFEGHRRIYIGELEQTTFYYIRYQAGEGRQWINSNGSTTTHWMPLPKLP